MRSAYHRPIAVTKLALEAGDGDGSKMPAVARSVPIVSHDEAIIFGNGDWTKIGGWLFRGDENPILSAVVVFVENFAGESRIAGGRCGRADGLAGKLNAIDIQVTRFYFHPVTSKGDDAFDVEDTAIIWIDKQDHVAPLRISGLIGVFDGDYSIIWKNRW